MKKIENALAKGKELLGYLTASPRLEDTEEARSFERYRRCAWTSVVMMGMRGSNILIGIVSVPLTLKYLGADLFGVWMILTTIVGFASFTDFGLGVGLRNSIIRLAAHKDYDSIRQYISNALAFLSLVSLVIIAISVLIVPNVSWGNVIKCENAEAAKQIGLALCGMLIAFALSLPIHQILNIASGLQSAYWGYGVYLVGRIASFVFICLCIKFQWSFFVLTTGYLGMPTLFLFLSWIVFWKVRPRYIPKSFKWNKAILKDLFGIGVYSLLHNISYAVMNSSTIFLIGNTICASASVSFSVAQKLFSLPSVFSASLLMGLNVAVGDAWHSGNFPWIDTAIRRNCRLIWPIVVSLALVFVLAGDKIIIWWTRSSEALPSLWLLIICAFKCAVDIYASLYSGFLIGVNHVKEVAFYQLFWGIIAIIAGYFIGVATQNATLVVFSNLIGALPCAFCYHLKFNEILKKQRNLAG